MRLYLTLTLASCGSLLASIPDNIARPDIENTFNSVTNASTSGVIFYNAGIANGNNNVIPGTAGTPIPDAVPTTRSSNAPSLLSEFSFGTTFSEYQSPYSGFSKDVLFNGRTLANGTTIPPVYPALYPAGYGTPGGITANRAGITADTNVAFRYKWLMYGEEVGNTDQDPPILNIFNESADSDTWFTDADRANARAQIAVLQEALALSPLDRELQGALLDIYYDWAVAEMQFARKKIVDLSTVRLGLLTASDFIIDEEIEAYKELVEITQTVLELYGELFSFEMEGFNPTDLFETTISTTQSDPTQGAPFGYFIFQNQVPLRTQTPTEYASTSSNVITNVIEPGETNTFSGFKDYRTVLTILGQHIQYQAEIGRLRGMRRATTPDGDDITIARDALTSTQTGAATMVGLFRHMFQSFNFDDPLFDSTGVRGAQVTATTALNDAQGVRSFINGTSNILGLDPNFLLLMPAQQGSGLFDSYDILNLALTENNGPLTVALEALGIGSLNGARQEYENFRENVDNVSNELAGLEDDFAIRFEEITGYPYETEGNNWNQIRPKAGVGSELATADRAIQSLATQNTTLATITNQLLIDIAKAEEAVTLANNIDDAITGAQSTYESTTSGAWTEIHVWAGAAAGAQALADGVYNAAGVDGVSTFFSGGGNAIAIVAAAAVNTAAQTAAATRTSMREQEIDKAAIAFDTTLALAEAPLTVKQAEIEVGALLREAYANRLEIEDTFTAFAQAIADRTALLREVQRIEENLLADRAALAEKFYADPIHYVRAERKILKANSAFRTAQRWVFFTCRALEYKWQERFAIEGVIGSSEDDTSFDIGSILKARNAEELENIVEKMAQFNLARTPNTQTVLANTDTTIISMRDQFLTPNPLDINLDFSPTLADDGLRYDVSSSSVVDKQTRFHQLLEGYKDQTGNIVIPFDTTVLENFGSFFQGADFSDLGNPDSGFYRNKIDWIAVNIIASNGNTPPNGNGRGGRITYAGNTFFRTRVPICPDRTTASTVASSSSFDASKDFGSEFVVQPFRYYQDTNFTGVFDLFNVQNVTGMKFAYSADSANNQAVLNRISDPFFAFFRQDLKERSVAATRWQLRIDANEVLVDDIIDIELIIRHNRHPRPQITCD